MLILKILDSHPNGEAPTSDITRELALLDSAARESSVPSAPIEGGIFGSGFVTSPRKGVWRISDAGRQYLRLADAGRDVKRTAKVSPLDVAPAGEIPMDE